MPMAQATAAFGSETFEKCITLTIRRNRAAILLQKKYVSKLIGSTAHLHRGQVALQLNQGEMHSL